MVESYIPTSLYDCLEELNHKVYWIFAGGTDLMIRKRQWQGASRNFKKPIIFINNLEELKGISSDENNIYIKACTTQREVVTNEQIPKILRMAVAQMAAPPTRSIATIGGNICNAAKVGDSIPIFYLLDAKVEIKSKFDTRITPIEEFIVGKYQTNLRADELLYQIIIPNKKFDINFYHKLGNRHGDILSKLSTAFVMNIRDHKVEDFRAVFGAINDLPIRRRTLENLLIGKKIEKAQAKIYDLIMGYEKVFDAEDDKRSTKQYREVTALKLLRKFLKEELYDEEL